MKLMKRRTDAKMDRFGALPVFRGCSPEELCIAAGILDEAVIPEGRVLTRQGAPALQAYLVVRGTVRLEVDGAPAGEVGPGASVGLPSLMDDRLHTATATALTGVHVLVLTQQSLGRLLLAVPTCSRSLVGSALRAGQAA